MAKDSSAQKTWKVTEYFEFVSREDSFVLHSSFGKSGSDFASFLRSGRGWRQHIHRMCVCPTVHVYEGNVAAVPLVPASIYTPDIHEV